MMKTKEKKIIFCGGDGKTWKICENCWVSSHIRKKLHFLKKFYP